MPIDKKEWIFSAVEGVWVQNLVLDLEGLSPMDMWQQISRLKPRVARMETLSHT